MSRLHVFADEAGCFTFERKPNVSKYFILCTVSMRDCSIGSELLNLRRELVWKGVKLGEYFHASNDQQIIRDEVFKVICNHDLRIQATIMEKSKAQPQVRVDRPTFYQYGWFFHFRHGIAKSIPTCVETLVTAATLGTGREKAAFLRAVNSVMAQILPFGSWKTDFCPAAADPCVQVADYCAWAIQRKLERGDSRAYDLIKQKIVYEYDLWQRGTTHHY
jgi:hypothetical protein